MIPRLYHMVIVVVLLVLLVLGLNTSNKGINHLTMDNRGPVIGLNFEREKVIVHWGGENYSFSTDKLSGIEFEAEGMYLKTKQYFVKMWRIFKAVFLY